MKFENFEKIIHLIKENDKWISTCYDIGIDIMNSPIQLRNSTIINCFFIEIYGKYGADLISWWLYEDVDKTISWMNSKNKKCSKDLTDVKSLWKYLEKTYSRSNK